MTTDYDWWNEALRGNIPDVVEGDPKPGYYRIKNKDGTWAPLAIWRDGFEIFALRGDESGDDYEDPEKIWLWCCKYPIPYQAYLDVARHGKPWPFEIPREATIGDNSAGAPPHELIGEKLTRLRTAADLWLQSLGGALKTQDDADKAAAFAQEIATLQKEAEEGFTTEKKPWLDGGRAVDDRWRNVREACTSNLRWLKELAGAWMKAEKARREEAARKANEEAKARAAAEGLDAPAAPAVVAAPVRAGARGASRAITQRTVKRAEITDIAALAAYIAKLDTPPTDFVQECRKIAHKLLTNGINVPGARLVEEEVAA